MRILTAEEVERVSGADYGRCVQNWTVAGRTAGTMVGMLGGGIACEPLGGGGGAACRSALGYIGGTVGESAGRELGEFYCEPGFEGVLNSNGNLDSWDPEPAMEPGIWSPAASLESFGGGPLNPFEQAVA